MVHVLYTHAKNLRHVSHQNRVTLKEFEATTREIIFLPQHTFSSGNASGKPLRWLFAKRFQNNLLENGFSSI